MSLDFFPIAFFFFRKFSKIGAFYPWSFPRLLYTYLLFCPQALKPPSPHQSPARSLLGNGEGVMGWRKKKSNPVVLANHHTHTHTFYLGLQRHLVRVGVSEQQSVSSAAVLHYNDAQRVHVHGWLGRGTCTPCISCTPKWVVAVNYNLL